MMKPTIPTATTPPLLGQSPELQAVLRAAQMAAVTEVTMLLLGESGTGKELLAQTVHAASRRADRPFVALNCAALPPTLAESELFGHRKGAFTGAIADHEGYLGAAEGGTLLLDEVGELPLSLQPKLLRFLESGEYQPVGSSRPRRANIRILAATHCPLAQQVAAGTFRADLFYRLNVVALELPPLRHRTGDLPLLLTALSGQLAAKYQLPPPRYTSAAQKQLQRYSWPGNLRELRNFCERMVIFCSGREVDLANLPPEMRAEADPPSSPITLPTEGVRLEEVERSLIQQALQRTIGNRSQAARLLGISRDTLLYRLKKYALI